MATSSPVPDIDLVEVEKMGAEQENGTSLT
jgi:hypothetical protein